MTDIVPHLCTGVKVVIAQIKHQFNYLYFSRNINGLKDEAIKLEAVIQGWQAQVNDAMDNLQEIDPEVTTLLRDFDNFKNEMNIILNEVPNVESGCLRVIKRVSLSKRAKNTTEALAQYLQNSNYNNVSVPSVPRFALELSIPTTTHVDRFASRENIEEDIMKTLRDEEDVSMIGIFGMAGVGKTTMAKRIMARALEEQVFQEAVTVDVGRELFPYEVDWEYIVQKLDARLAAGGKRILLLLDDVWRRLDLENLGIPCGSKGCTILITSQNSDTLSAMNVKKIYRIKQLSEEEAWVLFRENAGTCVDNLQLSSTAKQVVKQCGGVPLALRCLASALKDKMSLSVWKEVLNQLTKLTQNESLDSNEAFWYILRLSYESLDSNEAKSLFLLCCLFPRDYKIQVTQLTCFSIGLRIFEDMESLEEVRIRICALIKMLKSRSLLLDDHIDDQVRMYDLVRCGCILIAKEKGYIGGNNCTWISSLHLQEGTDLPTVLEFPFLRLLFSRERELKIDNTFFEGIKGLSVLSLENYSWTLLPHSRQTLKELKTLILNSCWGLETISVVGELVNLEILICCGCGSLKELPTEIRGLNHLKLLELSRCGNLQSIGPGIISSLTGLQELKMLGSFNKWEVGEDTERQKNAGLRELDSLTNLTFLEIEIQDPALAAEEIRTLVDLRIISKGYNSEARLHWEKGNNLDLEKVPNIQRLQLSNYQTLKNIVRTSMYDYDERYRDAIVFPLVENLLLFSLSELEYIRNIGWPISSDSFKSFKEIRLEFLPALKQLWPSSGIPYQMNVVSYFSQLSSICIYGCQRLRSLFSLLMTEEGPCLPQLERLDIESCDMMEYVFLWNEELKTHRKDHITLVFPKLKFLSLCFLPMLTNFCEGIERVEFPLLPQMKIVNCPKLKKYAHSHEKRILINTSTSVRHQRHKDTNNALEQRSLGAEEKGKMRLEDSSNDGLE